MIVRFADIGGIIDHHWLSFLYIIFFYLNEESILKDAYELDLDLRVLLPWIWWIMRRIKANQTFPPEVNYNCYYIMILFKKIYWLSCCHLTFRKVWYCLIKTRIDLVSLSFSNEIYKKNHLNSISIRPMDIKVMWNFVQSESSY